MKGLRLLHMGSPVIDLTYRIDQLPLLGSESLASDASVTAGGGFNMMAAARAAGMAVACGGRVGAGPNGDFLMQALDAAGIALIGPRAAHSDSGTCVVLVTADGERTFVSHPGAEGRIEPADLAPVHAEPDDVVFISGYTLAYPDAAAALCDWIAALPLDVLLAFDPAPLVLRISPDVLRPVLARTDWLSCSSAEAIGMTGETGLKAAADALLGEWRSTNLVLRDGPRGCLLKRAGSPALRFPGYSVPVFDTNGAGDTHFGAFLAEFARGQDAAGAARYANAAAALSVMRRSGSVAPSDAEIRAFLEAPNSGPFARD